jgi:uncharacterized membrane-anchored protein YhcB (DUF1043 family)
MSENLVLSIVEIAISLVVEGIILSMVFNWISNKETEKQQQNLKKEMGTIENQNKLIYEQLQMDIRQSKTEIISQIKESSKGVENSVKNL